MIANIKCQVLLAMKGGESMAIIRWNPFNLSSVLDDDFELPTLPGLSRFGQGLNLYETEQSLVAEASVPGITEEQIDVTVDNGVVHVTAHSEESEDKSKRRYFMSSRSTSFNYTFRLPEGMVEEGEPQAELHNGVLTLTFVKVKKVPPKKVKVVAKSTK